jgi:hypothetical protein
MLRPTMQIIEVLKAGELLRQVLGIPVFGEPG